MRHITLLLFASSLWAQTAQSQFTQHVLQTKQYSQEENEQIVKQFQGLRTTDVVDGLDAVGIGDQTWMDPGILPVWRDEVKFTHRIYGVAVTLRIVPPQTRAPGCGSLTAEECDKWRKQLEQMGYDSAYALPLKKRGAGPPRGGVSEYFKPDTVLVIDQRGTRSNGYCGSANTYGWVLNGVRGVVTETGCRDTDETILERLPIYQRGTTFGVNQGREIVESWNAPVVVGGVLVMPGDVIVADGNGVVVVPRAHAAAVAAAARKVQEGDMASRRKLYEKAKRPVDFTVTPRQ